MERDFMGLNSKKPIYVKEERCEDSGFARSSGLPWVLPNKKVSTIARYTAVEENLINNLGSTTNMQHFLGRSPLAAASTQQRNNSKTLNGPAQLTIFYGGNVCVFNDITPEMAQAIIFLAGKGVTAQPKVTVGDHVPNSGHQSPISVSSHLNDGTIIASPANDDELAKIEPPTPKIMASASASAMISAAVPQARKASLARFLEKRKERVMNAAPYAASKMSGYTVSGAGSSTDIAGDV